MTNEAIEAAARAICQELGIRNWDETAEDRGDLRMKVRGSYNTYDVNEPTKMDLRDAARAAAPALMEEGARLALEAAAGYLDGRGGIVIPGTVAFASLVSGNNQPCMSGNPADRLHPPQRRKFDDATATLAEAIRALDPAAIVKGAGRE